MIYNGPEAFKASIEALYSSLAENYERTDQLIICGVAHPLYVDGDMTEEIGFPNQEEFNKFVDAELGELFKHIEVAKQTGMTPEYQQKFMETAGKLQQYTSLFNDDIENVACYSFIDDAVFVDPFVAFCFTLGGGKTTSRELNLTRQMTHELAHSDIGKCKWPVDMQNTVREANYMLNTYTKGCQLMAKGEEAFLEWLDGEGREPHEKLEAKLGRVPKPSDFVEECDRQMDRQEALNHFGNQLGLHAANEAIAYCYIEDRDTMVKWLAAEPQPIETEKVMQMYDRIEQKVRQQGKLATLKEVKKAIDAAYEAKKSILEFL